MILLILSQLEPEYFPSNFLNNLILCAVYINDHPLILIVTARAAPTTDRGTRMRRHRKHTGIDAAARTAAGSAAEWLSAAESAASKAKSMLIV